MGTSAESTRHKCDIHRRQEGTAYSISYTLYTPPRVTYLFHVPHSHVLYRLYHSPRTFVHTNWKVALTGKPTTTTTPTHNLTHHCHHAYRTRRAVRNPPNLHLRRLHPRPKQKSSPLARSPGSRRRHHRPLLLRAHNQARGTVHGRLCLRRPVRVRQRPLQDGGPMVRSSEALQRYLQTLSLKSIVSC